MGNLIPEMEKWMINYVVEVISPSAKRPTNNFPIRFWVSETRMQTSLSDYCQTKRKVHWLTLSTGRVPGGMAKSKNAIWPADMLGGFVNTVSKYKSWPRLS